MSNRQYHRNIYQGSRSTPRRHANKKTSHTKHKKKKISSDELSMDWIWNVLLRLLLENLFQVLCWRLWSLWEVGPDWQKQIARVLPLNFACASISSLTSISSSLLPIWCHVSSFHSILSLQRVRPFYSTFLSEPWTKVKQLFLKLLCQIFGYSEEKRNKHRRLCSNEFAGEFTFEELEVTECPTKLWHNKMNTIKIDKLRQMEFTK